MTKEHALKIIRQLQSAVNAFTHGPSATEKIAQGFGAFVHNFLNRPDPPVRVAATARYRPFDEKLSQLSEALGKLGLPQSDVSTSVLQQIAQYVQFGNSVNATNNNIVEATRLWNTVTDQTDAQARTNADNWAVNNPYVLPY